MPLAFHYAARSDVGMVRSNNEDSGYAGPHLLAMADGMGGHAGGDVASSSVVGALVDLDGEALSAAEASQALLDRIQSANRDLGEQIAEDANLKGMGTTLIAMLRWDDTLVLAHIGDSRAFMRRDGTVTQITKDHSFVQTLVDEGRISAEDAKTHPQRSLVTRVLTGNPSDEPDLVVRQVRAGDRYLIASDGLTDYVARDTIDEVVARTEDPGRCADRLVELALKAGAPDNVTVVVGDVVDTAQSPAPPTQPEIVGAAAERTSTRPIPTTPAAKAAALSARASARRPAAASGAGASAGATGTSGVTGDDVDSQPRVALAEEGGPRSRSAKALRLSAVVVTVLVVLAGGAYAGYGWLTKQYFIGGQDGYVTVYRGVDQSVGPVDLFRVERTTAIPIEDLPTSYQVALAGGIEVSGPQAASDRVTDLALQAAACRYARLTGSECETVSPDWTTPTPTPTPSPTLSPSTRQSDGPSPTITAVRT